MTESERKFERFCNQNHIEIDRIEECSEKRPDYIIRCRQSDIVTEVKQIEPTAEEEVMLAVPLEEWDAQKVYHWGLPGERIRAKIKSSVPQLRKLSRGTKPTLLVVFDTVAFWPELVDSNAVKVAMYGIETALISPEVAPGGGATVIAKWHGARRRATRQHNTTLSAVAVLAEIEGQLQLDIYHNFFAVVPLSPDLMRNTGVRHFELESSPESGFPSWNLC